MNSQNRTADAANIGGYEGEILAETSTLGALHDTSEQAESQADLPPIGKLRAFDAGIAARYGLDEAVVFGQIKYWVDKNTADEKCFKNGKHWTFASYEQWHEQMPWYSVSTIKRIIARLKKHGLIIVGRYDKNNYNQTRWYTVNADAPIFSLGQNEPMREGQIDPLDSVNLNQSTYTAYNTANNTEIKRKRPNSQSEPGQLPESLDDFKTALSAVNDFIDAWYTEQYWRKHKQVPRKQRIAFAKKLSSCAAELELNIADVTSAVHTALREEEHGDMTIFLATTPEQLSYWLVRTGACSVISLRGTSYDYERLVVGN